MGNYIFQGCIALTSVTWSNISGLIPVGAFSGCKSLITMVIPDSVTTIGNNAFEGVHIVCFYWNKAIPRSVGTNNGAVSYGSTTNTDMRIYNNNEVYAKYIGTTTPPTINCCNDGQYIKEGVSYSCELCPPGTFAKGVVMKCELCPPGYTSGTGSSSCTACPLGTVALTPGSLSCTYWYAHTLISM